MQKANELQAKQQEHASSAPARSSYVTEGPEATYQASTEQHTSGTAAGLVVVAGGEAQQWVFGVGSQPDRAGVLE